jgi:hypothetical protein
MSKELQRLSDYAYSAFLQYLKYSSLQDSVNKLIFVDRDCYFLFSLWQNDAINSLISSEYLITNREILSKIDLEIVESKEKKYINQFFENDSNVAIVDIGWTGKSKQLIEKICRRKIRTYFFGAHKTNDLSIKSLFKRSRIGKFLGETELLEHIFTAPYPQAMRVYGNRDAPIVERHEIDLENLDEYFFLQSRFAEFRIRPMKSILRSKIIIKALTYKILIFPTWETIMEFKNAKHSVLPGEIRKIPLVNFFIAEEQDRILFPFWNLRVVFNFRSGYEFHRGKLLLGFIIIYSQLLRKKFYKSLRGYAK